jgi:acetyl-CoA carboxylase biotin carboxylase subunit
LPLHLWILEQPEFLSGDYTIHWLEKKLAEKAEADAQAAA